MEAAICTEMGETILQSQHEWAWLYEAENVCAGGEGVVNTQKEKGHKDEVDQRGEKGGEVHRPVGEHEKEKGCEMWCAWGQERHRRAG